MQHTATQCNTLQLNATHCNSMQHTAAHCNILQHYAAHCSTMQHTATHCNKCVGAQLSPHCNHPHSHTHTHTNTHTHTHTYTHTRWVQRVRGTQFVSWRKKAYPFLAHTQLLYPKPNPRTPKSYILLKP